MPLFEIESGGKTFEVEAPDQQSAVNALGGERSVGGFLSNLATNAQEVGGELYEAATSPVESAKSIGKLGVGMVQQFIPGQQEYETTHADPFYKTVAKDIGFGREEDGSIGWSGERLAKNAYERPVDLALDVSMGTGGAGAVMRGAPGAIGATGRGLSQVSKYTNPLYLPAKAVTTVAKRAITPFPARPGAADAAKVMDQEGVPLTAGQATGNKALKYAESELGAGQVTNKIDEQNAAFTKASAARMGETADNLDGPTMQAAYDRIGGEIGAVAKRHALTVDSPMQRGTYNAAGEYNSRVPPSQRAPIVAEFLAEIQSMRGKVPGDLYQDLRSRIGAEARAQRDPHTQHALYKMQRAIDDAFERSLTVAGAPDDVTAMKLARKQYRNYLVLEDAMAVGGQETAAGVVTPAKLEQAAAGRLGRRAYLHGSEFTELAKAGKVAMSKMPESGTSARAWMRAVPAVIGSALAGGGTLGVGAVAGAVAGAALPAAAGRVLMSKPVQKYLSNQVTSRIPQAPGVVKDAARLTPQIAARQEALRHAENVVSPKVMEHIKKSANTRGHLNDWLRARESGQDVEGATLALAEAIAKEVQKPELVGRIAQELNQAKGP
jgi:hypothetical protein